MSDPKFAPFLATLEERGAHEVRLSLASGVFYPVDMQHVAIGWLAEQDAETARQAEAWRTQEVSTASKANRMLRAVNGIIIAIAALTLIVSILAWVFPRR